MKVHGEIPNYVYLKEEWKDVPGLEDLQASSSGRFRIKCFIDGKNFYLSIEPHRHSSGYMILRYDSVPYRAHILIAKAFIPDPENLPCINHLNGRKDDNRVENLQRCSHQENTTHAIYSLGYRTQFGMKAVCMMRGEDIIKTYPSIKEASRSLGCQSTQLSRACRKKTEFRGFFFKYV